MDAVQAVVDTRLGELLKTSSEKATQAAIDERAGEILRRMNAERETERLTETIKTALDRILINRFTAKERSQNSHLGTMTLERPRSF